MEVRGMRCLCLHPTPDLDNRWHAIVVTEISPFSPEEAAIISMGFSFIRRESDVAEWESTDWKVQRVHEIYAEPLSTSKLTLAQKVLLMYCTIT